MLKKTSFLIIFFIALSIPSQAQIKKGYHSFSIHQSHLFPNVSEDKLNKVFNMGARFEDGLNIQLLKSSYQFQANYDHMITGRLMLGGTLGLRNRNIIYRFNIDPNPSSLGFRDIMRVSSFDSDTKNVYSFHLNPRIRFFLTKRRLSTYAFSELRAEVQKNYNSPSLNELSFNTNTDFSQVGGVGAHYYISPRVALEAQIGVTIWSSNKLGTYSGSLGLKIFGADFKNLSKDYLAKSMLKKGRLGINGLFSFFLNRKEEEPNGYIQGTYFILNSLEASVFMTQYEGENFDYSFTLQYYIKIRPQCYLSIASGLRKTQIYSNSKRKRHALIARSLFGLTSSSSRKNTSIPFSLTAHIFRGNKRWYVGSTYFYQFDNEYYFDLWNIYSGLEYFITKNISFKGELNLSFTRRYHKENTELYYLPNKSLQCTTGFHFWL